MTDTPTTKIKIWVSIGLVGCRRTTVVDVDPGMSNEAIDDLVKEIVFGEEMVTYGWHQVEDK